MADLNFNCPQCGQNLTTDESLSGSEIECPSCNKPIQIPAAGDENVLKVESEPPIPPVTSEPEAKKLAVPVHEGSTRPPVFSLPSYPDCPARTLAVAGTAQTPHLASEVPRQ